MNEPKAGHVCENEMCTEHCSRECQKDDWNLHKKVSNSVNAHSTTRLGNAQDSGKRIKLDVVKGRGAVLNRGSIPDHQESLISSMPELEYTVTSLDGSQCIVKLSSTARISDARIAIQSKLGHAPMRQKLFVKNKDAHLPSNAVVKVEIGQSEPMFWLVLAELLCFSCEEDIKHTPELFCKLCSSYHCQSCRTTSICNKCMVSSCSKCRLHCVDCKKCDTCIVRRPWFADDGTNAVDIALCEKCNQVSLSFLSNL